LSLRGLPAVVWTKMFVPPSCRLICARPEGDSANPALKIRNVSMDLRWFIIVDVVF
jgi:hypothetical protein